MSAKLIRRLTDLVPIYSPGRSDAGYLFYDGSALWCVDVISWLRRLGLTIEEIAQVGESHLGGSDDGMRRSLAYALQTARFRLDSKITQIEEVRAHQDEVMGEGGLR